jgi:hypothetical protein
MALEVLVGIAAGVLAAEMCGIFAWLAQVLVRWSVWLSYGRSPRGVSRYGEYIHDLHGIPFNLGKICYASGLLGRGLRDRMLGDAGVGTVGGALDAMYLSAAAGAIGKVFSGIDLRILPSDRLKEIKRAAAQLMDVLNRPAGTIDPRILRALLPATSDATLAYTTFRDERYALQLAEAALPHLCSLPACSPETFAIRRNHAYALLQLGQKERAVGLLRSLRSDECMILDADDYERVATERLYAWSMAEIGHAEQAVQALRSLASRLRHAPEMHVALLKHIECMLSWALWLNGDLREAMASYDRVITGRALELGADQPDTLDARHSKGKMLTQAGDGAQARVILESVFADRKRIQGKKHPDTLESRKYLAVSCYLTQPESGRVARQSARELKRVLRRQVRMRGSDHPDTCATRRWLATITDSSEE